MEIKDAAVIGVVHRADGQPAAGAAVYLDSYFMPVGAQEPLGAEIRAAVQNEDGEWEWLENTPPPPHKPHSTTTDDQGRYAFPVSKELREVLDRDRIKVWAEQDELVAPKVLLRCESVPATAATLTLGPSLHPRVRLVDPDGAPVPDAYVDMSLTVRDRFGNGEAELLYSLGAFSDEHGIAQLPRVPDRRDWEVWLRINPKDMPRLLDMDFPRRKLRSDEPVEVRLPRGCRVRGRVEMPDGAPANNVMISSRRDRWDPDPNYGHSTTTAEDGTFELLGVPTTDAVLTFAEMPDPGPPGDDPFGRVEAGAKLTMRVNGKEGAVVDLGTVRLKAPMSITGVVLDREGKPATSGHVMLDAPGMGHPIGPDGRFEIVGVEPGTHTLKATIYEGARTIENPFHGELEATLPDIPAGSRDVVIRVTGGGNLIVRFHPLGRPTEALRVWSPSLCWGHCGGGPGAKCSEIRMTFEPGRRTDLRIEAEGYKTKMLGAVEILPDRPTIVDVELEPADETDRGK